MFSYKIFEVERGPVVQIFHGSNVIDECGPWENLVSAINWAKEYVDAKNNGLVEPRI